MKKSEVLILERDDMLDEHKGKSIFLLEFNDFKISITPFLDIPIILFIDINGHTKILKNRYGDKGNKMFIELIEDVKQNSIENQLGYSQEYFDDVISLCSY